MSSRDLRTFFDELPDYRVARTRRHKLVDIVLLVLVATIMGYEGWDDIHLFGVSRLKQLRTVLGLANGVPSADTLRRVIGGLDHVAFRTVFIEWARDLCQATAGKVSSWRSTARPFEVQHGQAAPTCIWSMPGCRTTSWRWAS